MKGPTYSPSVLSRVRFASLLLAFNSALVWNGSGLSRRTNSLADGMGSKACVRHFYRLISIVVLGIGLGQEWCKGRSSQRSIEHIPDREGLNGGIGTSSFSSSFPSFCSSCSCSCSCSCNNTNSSGGTSAGGGNGSPTSIFTTSSTTHATVSSSTIGIGATMGSSRVVSSGSRGVGESSQ